MAALKCKITQVHLLLRDSILTVYLMTQLEIPLASIGIGIGAESQRLLVPSKSQVIRNFRPLCVTTLAIQGQYVPLAPCIPLRMRLLMMEAH